MKTPPRWADRFFEWYCNPELLEDLQGDLHERFHDRVKRRGTFVARLLFILDVFVFFRPYVLKRKKSINSSPMILSNLRFSLRYFARQRFFTSLHIIGLTLGISVAFVIFSFIKYELSFDKSFSKTDRIYRINSSWKESNQLINMYATPMPFANVVQTQIAGIEKVTRVFSQYKGTFAITPDRVFSQDKVLIVESAYVDIFDVEILSGDKSALSKPYQALISQTTATKFFGHENPVGKSVRYRSKYDINIAGVFRDAPGNVSLPASVLLSFVDDKEFINNGDIWFFGGGEWTTLNSMTFALLDETTSPAEINSKLVSIADQNINIPKKNDGVHCTFELQLFSDAHLDTARFGGGPWTAAMDIQWLMIFGGIGLIVLLIAIVNFINLSTAQAIVRAKEAGIRKTIGANRSQLIIQFITEPLILVFVAAVLAVVIAMLITGSMNEVLGKQIDLMNVITPASVLMIIASLCFVGIAAGLYPAWLIASANPVASLKPGIAVKGNAMISWLRQGLIVIQFAVSAVLITIVFAISQQADFMNSKDLGFDKEGILMVRVPDKATSQSFINNINALNGVKQSSLSRVAPLSNDHWWNSIGKFGGAEVESACFISADENFVKLYNLKLLSGRIPVAADSLNEIHQCVVNERLLKVLELGAPEEAIGKRFLWSGTSEVTGVVADFNPFPLKYEIIPLLIFNQAELNTSANIKIDDIDNQYLLSTIESLWKKEFPSEPYEPKILRNEINSYYQSEATSYKLFLTFASVAVVISCLGLLGLCVFATVRRTKEVTIRKVLGASVERIIVLLSNSFLRLIAIACLVSIPAGWFCVDFLLKSYAYKISLTWNLFAFPIILLIGIAFVTILTQTIRAAVSDPVKNLRSE